ncbi:MAG: TraB/GumN family protein [Desulfobacterales bacterium]|nr:TraB/GumN family protein [Desulfobacterales bacterium]
MASRLNHRGGLRAGDVWLCIVAVLAAALTIMATRVLAGEVYRWRDANGVLHFADTPPDGPVENVRSTAAAAHAPEPANPEAATPESAKATQRISGGLFWRIDPPQRAPSFLLGTIHSADPRVTAIKPAVAQAFAQAPVFVMEMDLNAESFLSLGASMMFTDGRDLERLLGRDDFRKVAAAVSQHGIPEQMLRRMKPWAVLALLSQPKPQSGAFMDMLLFQRATAAGKTVVGLESAQEQIAVFNQMAMADQLALLRSSLAQSNQMAAMQERMITTYLTGDLEAIAGLTQEFIGPDASGLKRRFLQRLNDERNDRMLARMTPYIDSGGAFIAVGALHLTGERGLIRQLRARGYRLAPAN